MASIIFVSLLLSTAFTRFISCSGETDTHHVFSLSSLFPSETSCISTEEHNRTALTVVHRHGPCSPMPPEKKTLRQLLRQDQLRATSVKARISLSRRQGGGDQKPVDSKPLDSVAESRLPATYGVALSTANYVVTVGLGTPKQDMTVVFDTGSDLTWVQCKPCVGYCHDQQDPIYDPSKSSSYSNITCGAADCSLLRSATGNSGSCSSSTCVYGIQYGDKSYSVGYLASETLTLTPSDAVRDFKFGCGQKNRGLFGRTAGLLGLGRDRISLVYQAAGKYEQVFSYCLPSTSKTTGFLSFGLPKSSPASFKYTPVLSLDPPSFYFLEMVGIKVGGQLLNISGSVFSAAGTVIDSGTVITRLAPSAYSALRAAFRQGMAQYPTTVAVSILDTCYDLSSYNTVTVPKVAVMFRGGVEVDVALTGILLGTSASQVCLAFAGNSDATDIGILGNMQQKTYEVVYDAGNDRVGFAAGACS